MALGGISVTWNSAVPSVTSQAGVGYQDLQSIKSTLQQVMDSEHVFESTGGSNTGIHRKGSAVVFYGASSAISSTDTNGRLMIDSTNSRLFHVGSGDTRLLGGQYVPLMTPLSVTGNTVASKITQCFAMESSQFTFLNASTSTTITLQNTYVSAVAFVQQIPSATAPATATGVLLPGLVTGNSLPIYNSSNGTATGVSSTTTGLFNLLVIGIKAL